jgi:hypothetical protein
MSRGDDVLGALIVLRLLAIPAEPAIEQRDVSPRPGRGTLVAIPGAAHVDHADGLGRATQQLLGECRREAIGDEIVCHVSRNPDRASR